MLNTTFTEEQILKQVKESYTNGEVKFEFSAGKSALLVIDMQEEFVKPNSSPYWVPEATKQIPKIKKMIEHCRRIKIPVIFTVFSKTHQYMDRPVSGKFMPNRYSKYDLKYFIEGKVCDELKPLDDEIVIHKPSYGAFYDTPLETILKNLGKETIIICGTLTNYCCGMTARQGYERSFKVVFGSDITATDDPDMQEPELKVLRKGFALVLSSNEIVERLS